MEFPSAFGGHFMCMHIPPRKEEEYYTYSPRVGRGLMHPFLCVRSLGGIRHVPLLRNRCKNTPRPMAHDLCMFRL